MLDKKFITPYTQNWSLTLEREVLPNTLVRLGYVGTKATHLKTEYDQNPPIYDPETVAHPEPGEYRRPPSRQGFPDHLAVDARFEFELPRAPGVRGQALQPRLTVSASYTWSKNLDYASSNGFGGSRGVNNPFNFFFSRGNSDYTRTTVSSIPSCGTCPG